MKKPNAAVLAAAAGVKQTQSPDKLKLLREKIADARALELEIAELSEQMAEKQKKLYQIVGGGREPGELVGLFEELGISSMGLDAKGNLPAYDAEVKAFYSAGIPKDPKLATAALNHIEKVWRMPDLIKTQVSIDFGRGERTKFWALEKVL